MKVHIKQRNCSKDVLHSNSAIFREYVDSTSTKGVSKIFKRDYSAIRRLFWLIVFLIATTLCLLNCVERIKLYVSSPTSTAFSSAKIEPMTFPTVTICNLNGMTASGLAREGLLEVVDEISRFGTLSPDFVAKCTAIMNTNPRTRQVSLYDLKQNVTQPLRDFIRQCIFVDQPCQIDEDFKLTAHTYDMCYTFNGYSRVSSLQTNGPGSNHGLNLIVNIRQNEYVGSNLLDAGVKVLVHPTSEVARVLDQGIAAPPGRVLYIGVQQKDSINKAGVDCVKNFDVSRLNFLGNVLKYSVRTCIEDCVLTEIANTCDCSYIKTEIPPSNPAYANIRDCTFADICCIERVRVVDLDCDCPTACKSTTYDLTTSYSLFPAQYASNNYSIRSRLEKDFLVVSVYFQTLVVHKETTSYSYTFVALLSDLGGLLGLYLSISLISSLEFVIWVLDELVDRLCCFKLSCQRKKNQDREDEGTNMDEEGN